VFGEELFETTLKPHFELCLAGEQVIFDFWWDSPRGSRRHLDARYDPYFEADGSVSGVLVSARDTTDQKKFQERLESMVTDLEVANQELEAFSNALAHDLRNPLLIVTNFSHELRESLSASLDDQQKQDLKRIQDAGRHMVHIVDDLRDLADVNRAEITRREVDLSVLAQGIMEDLRVVVPDRDVEFEVERGIEALGDKTLLRILLTNLLQNAWKYTGPTEDARIELGVAENGDEIPTYYVKDNGIGFDNKSGEIIFQPFERLHNRSEFSGSGLGLATVERIVNRHGGKVWGEGVVGEGAVFYFTLEPSPTDPLEEFDPPRQHGR
jgi:light-regulated signal transduction histidine kinase (bacteriophytochrome)